MPLTHDLVLPMEAGLTVHACLFDPMAGHSAHGTRLRCSVCLVNGRMQSAELFVV